MVNLTRQLHCNGKYVNKKESKVEIRTPTEKRLHKIILGHRIEEIISVCRGKMENVTGSGQLETCSHSLLDDNSCGLPHFMYTSLLVGEPKISHSIMQTVVAIHTAQCSEEKRWHLIPVTLFLVQVGFLTAIFLTAIMANLYFVISLSVGIWKYCHINLFHLKPRLLNLNVTFYTCFLHLPFSAPTIGIIHLSFPALNVYCT